MTQLDTNLQIYGSAAHMFAGLVEGLSEPDLGRQATDEWTVRDLVGHTTRALTTVEEYLDVRGDHPQHLSPGEYYHQALQSIDDASVAERGRIAGAALDGDVGAAVIAIVDRVLALLDELGSEDAYGTDPVIVTRGGSLHLSAYLPTRTVELVLHGLDVAAAVGRDLMVPADAMRQTLEVISEIVILEGRGALLARALTGRGSLPAGFSALATR